MNVWSTFRIDPEIPYLVPIGIAFVMLNHKLKHWKGKR